MAQFYRSVPGSHRAQYQDPETEALMLYLHFSYCDISWKSTQLHSLEQRSNEPE